MRIGRHPKVLDEEHEQAKDGIPPGLLASIANFLDEHREDILNLIWAKGGWENWLQVSLARHINKTTDYCAVREENIFLRSSQRVDIWCTHKSEYSGWPGGISHDEPRIGIELKCSGDHQDYLSGNKICGLQNRFRDDINKILGGVDPESLTAAGATVYAVAIAQEEYETYAYEDVKAITDTEVQKWTSSGIVNDHTHIYMLWWGKLFFNGK